MSTPTIPSPRDPVDTAVTPTLQDIDGTCPQCGAVYGVDPDGRMPEHRIPPTIGRPVCPGSGQAGVQLRSRPYFFVEGVQWL